MEVKEQIAQWLQPHLEEKDAFLVDVKVLLGGKKLEVYVDTNNGVDILTCAEFSRVIEKHLDGTGLVPENYTLDVSSPGMTNPLKVPRQYQKRIGSILEIWLNDGTFIEGKLTDASDTNIVLQKVVKEKKKTKKKDQHPEPETPTVFTIKHSDIKKALIQLNW
jgi:ribosome maturation factor RimP